MSQSVSRAQGRKRKQTERSKQDAESGLIVTKSASTGSREDHTKRRKVLVTPGSHTGKPTPRKSRADTGLSPKQLFAQFDFFFVYSDYVGADRDLIDKCIAKGAVWSYKWHQAVTHAIAIDPIADNGSVREWYEQAERHGAPVVRSDWLLACFELDYVVKPLSAHILICPDRGTEISLISPPHGVPPEARVDGAFNPFNRLLGAKHDDETVDQFLERLQPESYLDGQSGRRIRVAYPGAFTADYPVKTGAFTRAGNEILRQYDRMVERKCLENPKWSQPQAVASLLDECNQLPSRIGDAARTYGVHCGKWILFDLEGATIARFWNVIVRETVAGALGSFAEVIQSIKNGPFTVCVGVVEKGDVQRIRTTIFNLRQRHSIRSDTTLRFKPEAASLLGLNFGNHYKIRTSVAPDFLDMFLEEKDSGWVRRKSLHIKSSAVED